MRSASFVLATALLLAVLATPGVAAQDPTCTDDLCVQGPCGNDPCVEPRVEVGPDGATVGYVHHMGLGGAGGVHTGPDGTYVYYGEGISGCQVGTNGIHCVH